MGQLTEKYGELTITRGRKHTYVGMEIEFNETKAVQISMKGYIEEAIEDCGEDVKGNKGRGMSTCRNYEAWREPTQGEGGTNFEGRTRPSLS